MVTMNARAFVIVRVTVRVKIMTRIRMGVKTELRFRGEYEVQVIVIG